MIAVLLACGWFVLVGLPVAFFLTRSQKLSLLIGSSFLLGNGLIVLLLLTISWTRSVILLVSLTIAVAFAFASRGLKLPRPRAEISKIALLLFGLVILTLVLHASFATLVPLREWDFAAIWGLKARIFFEHREVHWPFLEYSDRLASPHPDYPLLLPLTFDFVALLNGEWEPRWIGLLFSVYPSALLLIVYSTLREQMSQRWAAISLLALTGPALSLSIGLAEAPLMAFGGAGLLLVRSGLRANDAALIRTGGVLLGFAAWTKNEGLTLIVAAAIALWLQDRSRIRRLVQLWPAPLLVAPWLVARAQHRLSTDLAASGMAERFLHNLRSTGEFLNAIWTHTSQKLFWITVIVLVVIGAVRSRFAERFLIIAVALQLLFYLAAYLVSPYNLVDHVTFSWGRLLEHVAVPAGFAAICSGVVFPADRGASR